MTSAKTITHGTALIGALKAAPYNPRKIKGAAKDALKASIERFGLVQPIIVNSENMHVVGGHQRLQILKERGDTSVDVVWVSLTDTEEKQLNIVLNAKQAQGEFDETMLAAILPDLQIDPLGWDDLRLDDLAADYKLDFDDTRSDADDGEAAEKDADRVGADDLQVHSVSGRIYQLGPHRVICGSSTDPDVLAALMQGGQADAVWTDPPYNVAYVGKTKDALTIKNDEMSGGEFLQFLTAFYRNALNHTKAGGAIYVAHADSEGENFRRAMREGGWLLKQNLIWVKDSMVLGRQDHHWQHEPILYGWKDGAPHRWFGGRKKTTVIKIKRPKRATEHPTMKPLELIQWNLDNSTEAGDIVLDCFGGSGSTMMACAATGRVARLVELDPRFVDVIRRRWTRWCKAKGLDAGPDALEEDAADTRKKIADA